MSTETEVRDLESEIQRLQTENDKYREVKDAAIQTASLRDSITEAKEAHQIAKAASREAAEHLNNLRKEMDDYVDCFVCLGSGNQWQQRLPWVDEPTESGASDQLMADALLLDGTALVAASQAIHADGLNWKLSELSQQINPYDPKFRKFTKGWLDKCAEEQLLTVRDWVEDKQDSNRSGHPGAVDRCNFTDKAFNTMELIVDNHLSEHPPKKDEMDMIRAKADAQQDGQPVAGGTPGAQWG